METRKYRIRTNCLSCDKSTSGIAVVVVTGLPEDGNEERAFTGHERCPNAMIQDPSRANDADQSTVTKRPRF